MVRIEASSVTSLLSPDRIRVGLAGAGKDEVLEATVRLIEGADGVSDFERVRDDVGRREALMSTGVGKGLALPHARSAGVIATVAAFATTSRPVDWGAFDDQPVRLVLLLVGPEAERGAHVRLLSRVSRMMSDDAFRARLVAAGNVDDVLDAFAEAEEQLG
jgi:PTS system fructose-specific IIA component